MSQTTTNTKPFFKPSHILTRMREGYRLVFWYFYNNYPRPQYVGPRKIAWYYKNETIPLKTTVGFALKDMEARGFLEKRTKIVYRVTEKTRLVLDACGFKCAFKQPCRLKGTNMCPFRIGEVWEP